jgi:hypothetical protein
MFNGFTLFLDFDGVLVNGFSTVTSDNNKLAFDPVCVDNLKRIIDEIKNKYGRINIIVTSNWRYDLDDDAIIILLLNQSGLHKSISESDITVLDRKLRKVQGINQYIRENQLTPERSVILDDEYLGEKLAGYQIRTRSEDGIRGIDTLEGIVY